MASRGIKATDELYISEDTAHLAANLVEGLQIENLDSVFSDESDKIIPYKSECDVYHVSLSVMFLKLPQMMCTLSNKSNDS